MEGVAKKHELPQEMNSCPPSCPPSTESSLERKWNNLAAFLRNSSTPSAMSEIIEKISEGDDLDVKSVRNMTPVERQLLAEELEDQMKEIHIRKIQRALMHAGSGSTPHNTTPTTQTNCAKSCSAQITPTVPATPMLLGRLNTPSSIKSSKTMSFLNRVSPTAWDCCIAREKPE
jgi:hypothetical protein